MQDQRLSTLIFVISFKTCIYASVIVQETNITASTISPVNALINTTVDIFDNKEINFEPKSTPLQAGNRTFNLSNENFPDLPTTNRHASHSSQNITCNANDSLPAHCNHTKNQYPPNHDHLDDEIEFALAKQSDNSQQLQLESAKLINAEKGILHKQGSARENVGAPGAKSAANEKNALKLFNKARNERLAEERNWVNESSQNSALTSSVTQMSTNKVSETEKSLPGTGGLEGFDIQSTASQLLNGDDEFWTETNESTANDRLRPGPTSESNIKQKLTESNDGSATESSVATHRTFVDFPLLQDTFKYLITDYYPEKLLKSMTKRFNGAAANKTREASTFTPAVVYPLLMEGVSILFNKLTSNESVEDDVEPGETVRGKIAQGMFESINKLFRAKESRKADEESLERNSRDGSDGLLNMETFNRVMPILRRVQNNGELQNTVASLMGNSKSSANMGDWDKLFKNYGPGLTGILNKTQVVNALMHRDSNSTGSVNLTNIMEHFMPKMGNQSGAREDGISPTNPLLRSEFVTKIVSKSPVAHLGALDDSILRLVTSSLEKAVTRVKINESGQIQMSDGMKNMLVKMIEDREAKRPHNGTTSSASDSIYDLLKSAIASSGDSGSATSSIEGSQPRTRRNNTRISPLHRKFQMKYGKGAAAVSFQGLFSSCMIIAISLNALQIL